MSAINLDLSPASMARAIQDNLVACFRMLAGPLGAVRDEDGITAITTGIPLSPFNGVYRAEFPVDVSPVERRTRMDAALTYLEGTGAPYSWYVMPSSSSRDVTKFLTARGFHRTAASPGMAVDLHALHEDIPVPEGFAVESVRDAAALRAWIHTSDTGFGLPDTFDDLMYAALRTLELNDTVTAQLYLGRVAGDPVATSFSVEAAGVVGLYTITTLPEHRGKGIGAAMTIAPLRVARSHGYRIGILEASSMGFPVYQRLGFQRYITVEHYEPPDASHD